MKKIMLLFLLIAVKIVSAQKIPTLYFKGTTSPKIKKSVTIINTTGGNTLVSIYNKEIVDMWRKKTPAQVNTLYRHKPNIVNFSYNKMGYIKLEVPSNLMKQVLMKEFEFSEKELVEKGL